MIEWLTFFVIMAVGQFSPGPDMVLLTRVSLADGKVAGMATACGIASGLMIHAGIAVSGLAYVLAENEAIYGWIKYAASGYLLWLAYQLLRSVNKKSVFRVEDVGSLVSERVGFLGYWKVGFLCNMLNPKVVIFLGGVTMPFLEMEGGEISGLGVSGWAMILWVTVFMEGLVLWCLWVRLLQVSGIKRFYQERAHLIDGVFGLALIALAVLLLIEPPHFESLIFNG